MIHRFSLVAYHITSAKKHVDLSTKIGAMEQELVTSEIYSEYVGYIISSITSATAYLETMVNEIFSHAVDRHGMSFKQLDVLGQATLQIMASIWNIEYFRQHVGTLVKYSVKNGTRS
jgi:hypothetical protein